MWTLDDELASTCPFLCENCAVRNGRIFRIESRRFCNRRAEVYRKADAGPIDFRLLGRKWRRMEG